MRFGLETLISRMRPQSQGNLALRYDHAPSHLYVVPEPAKIIQFPAHSNIVTFPTAYHSRSLETQDDLDLLKSYSSQHKNMASLIGSLDSELGNDSYHVTIRSIRGALERSIPVDGSMFHGQAVDSFAHQVATTYNSYDMETGKRLTTSQIVERMNANLSHDGYKGPAFTEKDLYGFLHIGEQTGCRIAWKRAHKPGLFAPMRARDLA